MTLAQFARHLNRRSRAAHLPPLILLTDRRRLADPAAAAARLPPGSAVILRDYDDPDRAALARRLRRITRARRVLLLVAGDFRLAAAVDADGVHLPEGMARHGLLGPLLDWRRRAGKLLTVAAHSRGALARAAAIGADAALLSPVFATASHPGNDVLGPLKFRRLAAGASLPVVALGGIDTGTVRCLLGSGAAGVAGIGGLGGLGKRLDK